LRDRILAVKQEEIKEVKIENPELVRQLFVDRVKNYKPRHQRDIGRIFSLIKVFALLNLWFRVRNGSVIIASDEDIKDAFKVWDSISESQELNLPPFVYNLYKDIIVAAYKEKNGEPEGVLKIGLSRQDLMQKHFQVYGRFLPDWMWRQQIIPQLETTGLITQEPDPIDKRRVLIYPTTLLTVSNQSNGQNYSELEGRAYNRIIDIAIDNILRRQLEKENKGIDSKSTQKYTRSSNGKSRRISHPRRGSQKAKSQKNYNLPHGQKRKATSSQVW
jgi:hypothetical protein